MGQFFIKFHTSLKADISPTCPLGLGRKVEERGRRNRSFLPMFKCAQSFPLPACRSKG